MLVCVEGHIVVWDILAENIVFLPGTSSLPEERLTSMQPETTVASLVCFLHCLSCVVLCVVLALIVMLTRPRHLASGPKLYQGG